MTEVAAKRAVIQITDGKMVKYDLVCLDTGGRITDISSKEVTGYYANEWVEVAVKINTSTQKYSILIGGQTVKERIPISGLSGISAVGMTAYKNEAQECTMYVKYLRAYAGPERRAEFPAVAYNYETVEAKTDEVKLIEDKASLILSENFNAVNEGSMPSSMKAVNDVKAKKEQKNENRYVHISKADGNDAYVQIPLNMIFTTVVFQADYMYMQNSGGIELFQLKDAQDQFGNFVKINASGSLALYNDQKVGNYNFKDKWVNVAVAMDFDQKIFNVYINGKLEAKDVPFQNMSLSSNVAISRLTTTWNSKNGDNFGVDNIRIYSGMSLAGKFDEEDDGIEEVDESQIDKTPFRTDMTKFTPIKQDEYSNPSSYFSSYDNMKKNLKGKYAFVAENNKAWIQDDKYEMQSPAGLKSGNVTLPLSEVANFTGLPLKKTEDGTVWLGDNIAVKAGEKIMTAHGGQVELPVAAEEINGQLYVAAKPVSYTHLPRYPQGLAGRFGAGGAGNHRGMAPGTAAL